MFVLILKAAGELGRTRCIQFADADAAAAEGKRQFRESRIQWTVCPLEQEV